MSIHLFHTLIPSIPFFVTLTFLISNKIYCSPLTLIETEREEEERRVSIEDSVVSSQIVFRGSTYAVDESEERGMNTNTVTAYFFLKNAYKGGNAINNLVANNLGRINVSFPVSGPFLEYKEDLESTPREYIIFSNLINGEIRATAAVKWSESNDYRVWKVLGWSEWSDWSSCSVSCSGGIQQHLRHCKGIKCYGFNVEQRYCNLFSCEDIVNPLAIEDHKSFHPGVEKWQRVPDRPSAWRLQPDSYIWLPSKELFRFHQEKTLFPKEFSVFLTIRLTNSTMGTIFSVRSRSHQDTYLSLEVTSRTPTVSTLKVIHASTANGTDVVRIPARLDDGHWHQLAIRDNTVVEIYVDCVWSKTEILRSQALDIPDDSDLIIGYLFSGDLEQLSIIPHPKMASQQCEDVRIPITDYQEILSRFRLKQKNSN